MDYFNFNSIDFYMQSLQRVDFFSGNLFKICGDRNFSKMKDNFQINQPSFKEVISNVDLHGPGGNIELLGSSGMSAISHIFSEKPLTCINTFPQVNFWETHREKRPFRFDRQGAQFGMVEPSPHQIAMKIGS